MKKLLATLAAGAVLFSATACSSNSDSASSSEGETAVVKVGALPVPAGDILNFVDENLAPEAGIDIEWVEFNDYNTPNPALADGTTDANLFQNQGFLDTYIEQTGDDLVSLGEIYLPAAAYHSEKFGSIEELPEGATIAIPNDPTNEGRALELLAASGVISVEDGVSNLDGVTDNPKNFKFIEVENATLPVALQDNDAAFVTSSFAIPAGLTSETSILSEDSGSKYYNVLATRADSEDDENLQTLKELLLSQETKNFINESWDGLIIPAE